MENETLGRSLCGVGCLWGLFTISDKPADGKASELSQQVEARLPRINAVIASLLSVPCLDGLIIEACT
jgi:hypothetical protein